MRKFAELAFTPSVRKVQSEQASPYADVFSDGSEVQRDTIGEMERLFIENRDGFYQATVSETGWPYVQFKGGARGFLRVVNESTIGYADFRGNRQYLSVGNILAGNKVALILMDYPNRRRLKVWAQAQIISKETHPETMQKLVNPNYRAHVERGVLLHVEAIDWNCPAHIPQRFTVEEIEFLATA